MENPPPINSKFDNQEKSPRHKGKKGKTIFILGDSLVKHVTGWSLTLQLNHNKKAHFRNFSSAKVKWMKDYVKLCIKANNPDHVIIHVEINDLNSKTTLERTANSFADVARNIKTEITFQWAYLGLHHDNLNNKALEVNQEYWRVAKKQNLIK